MTAKPKRTTIYFDPNLHMALRLKAVSVSRSVSDLVNDAVRRVLVEDAGDITAFEERDKDPLISYEEMIKRLKKMPEYKIYFKESVEKDFRVIPKKDVKKILQRIGLLTAEPRPPGCEKLAITSAV